MSTVSPANVNSPTASVSTKKGALASVRPDTLGAQVIRGLLQRVDLDPALLEDVILGCAYPEAAQGNNLARIVGILAGLPQHVGGMTVNRFCGSSMQAIHIAAAQIEGRYGRCVPVCRCGVDDDRAARGIQLLAKSGIGGELGGVPVDGRNSRERRSALQHLACRSGGISAAVPPKGCGGARAGTSARGNHCNSYRFPAMSSLKTAASARTQAPRLLRRFDRHSGRIELLRPAPRRH
jgi:hypothetical protein